MKEFEPRDIQPDEKDEELFNLEDNEIEFLGNQLYYFSMAATMLERMQRQPDRKKIEIAAQDRETGDVIKLNLGPNIVHIVTLLVADSFQNLSKLGEMKKANSILEQVAQHRVALLGENIPGGNS